MTALMEVKLKKIEMITTQDEAVSMKLYLLRNCEAGLGCVVNLTVGMLASAFTIADIWRNI